VPASSRLSPLQLALLEAFFEREQRFFLTGGAALSGFHLGHRETNDLDLFATGEASIEEGTRAFRAAAAHVGATLESLQESPDFRRFAARRGEELTVVDLVIDRAPQAFADKPSVGRVRLDPPREIAANKLCTLLDRMEIRDLVDLKVLLGTGITLVEALADARKKHAGADPGTLAWVLGEFRIPPHHPTMTATGLSAAELESFRGELVDALTRLALPPE
jgi:hypothetical protein